MIIQTCFWKNDVSISVQAIEILILVYLGRSIADYVLHYFLYPRSNLYHEIILLRHVVLVLLFYYPDLLLVTEHLDFLLLRTSGTRLE
jgi:hypothetical protein